MRTTVLLLCLLPLLSCGSDDEPSEAPAEPAHTRVPSGASVDLSSQQMSLEQALELARIGCLAKIPGAGIADRAFYDRQIKSHEETMENNSLSQATRDRSRRARDSALEQRAKLDQREREAQAARAQCELEVEAMRVRLRAKTTSAS